MTILARSRNEARDAAATAPSLVSRVRELEAQELVGVFGAARSIGEEAAIWLAADDTLAMVAIGSAWKATATGADRFREVAEAWSRLAEDAAVDGPDQVRGTGPLLVGGFGFADEPASSALWQGFEGAKLVLPRVLVTATGGRTWLTLNALPTDEIDGSERLWARVAAAAPDARDHGMEGPALRVVRAVPEAAAWQTKVARLAGAVGRGRLDKVVLARRVDLEATAVIEVPAVLRRLATAAGSTVFAVAAGDRTFLGATPERLASVEGGAFRTVAMAGSAGRGADAAEDQRLGDALLASEKEREEHRIVVEMLRETLAPICDELAIPGRPVVRQLRHIQHLVTNVEGRLRERAGVLDLVERLHPTPAVGGTPRELALELIGEQEGIERGWYAGPVGWVDARGDGEFVVGIRSGVVEGRTASLFAGCGIVADSDPVGEWQESVDKLRLMASALGTVAGS